MGALLTPSNGGERHLQPQDAFLWVLNTPITCLQPSPGRKRLIGVFRTQRMCLAAANVVLYVKQNLKIEACGWFWMYCMLPYSRLLNFTRLFFYILIRECFNTQNIWPSIWNSVWINRQTTSVHNAITINLFWDGVFYTLPFLSTSLFPAFRSFLSFPLPLPLPARSLKNAVRFPVGSRAEPRSRMYLNASGSCEC